mgnify:CR=1 FL=1
MLNFSKAAFCTAAAGAMAITSAAPAEAQRYRDRDRDGVSAGEVIAGALILGGIAAIASSSNRPLLVAIAGGVKSLDGL